MRAKIGHMYVMYTQCLGRGSPASPGTAASGQGQGAEVEAGAEQEARPRPLCHGAERRSFELEDIPDTASPASCHARLHLATRVEMEAGPPLSPHPRAEVRLILLEV